MKGSFSEKNIGLFLIEVSAAKAYFQKISKMPKINKV